MIRVMSESYSVITFIEQSRICIKMHWWPEGWKGNGIGLYRSSAPAPAEIRPFLQIPLISGSGQNWAGFEILSDLEHFH